MRCLAAVAVCVLASPANAAEAALCSALANLKTEAASSRTPQRIAVLKEEPMTFACGRKKEVAAQDRFCSAARDAVGLEFTHGFPWQIYECLTSQGVRPQVALVDQYTGMKNRKKIAHLWAAWRDGARLDMRFKPSGDFSKDARFLDYWGAYELVLWHP